MLLPDLPDFLKLPVDYRPERPSKRLKWTNEMVFTTKKKQEDPATRQLRREIERQEKERREERFRMLRERRK